MPVLLSQSPTERVAHLSLSTPILEEELGGEELAYLDIPSHLLPRSSTSRTGSSSSTFDERARTKSSDGAATTSAASVDKFDPGLMEPDVIQVELEVAPSVLVLYGSLLRNLIHLKVGEKKPPFYFVIVFEQGSDRFIDEKYNSQASLSIP